MNAMPAVHTAFVAGLLMTTAACSTSDPAPTPEAAPTHAAEATAVPTIAQPTPTAAAPTPTAAETTPATSTAAGIEVDPAKADATLVQLVDALDEPEYYCVDVPGFGASLNLQSALTAHTCKPGAEDEMFAVNRPGPGNLYMPAYDLCMEVDGTDAPVQLRLRECSDSAMQRFDIDLDGALVLSGTALCMAVSPEDGEPTGGPSHLRRDLFMLDCAETEPALRQWTFSGRSPE